MRFLDIDQSACEHLDIDIEKLGRAMQKLEQAVKEIDDLGLFIFGGAGKGTIRKYAPSVKGPPYVITHIIAGRFDGGDGGTHYDDDGFERGES